MLGDAVTTTIGRMPAARRSMTAIRLRPRRLHDSMRKIDEPATPPPDLEPAITPGGPLATPSSPEGRDAADAEGEEA
jgi:hypothetical protein